MKVKLLPFVLFVPCLLSLSGCYKDDIDDLKNSQKDHEERLTALEQWQATVNGNISSLQGVVYALENNDYVTSVVPVTEDGVTAGYTIYFTKSNPVTIRHGEKGDMGNDGHSPMIAAKQDTDGKYYWTLDGKWLLISGNKAPVTEEKGIPGADGKTPKVTIGTDNYWYISADGSATGPAPGSTWVSTGVKATGDTGDAIFKKGGIDNTNADYVVFTLADGTTTITLPKYMALGLAFPDLTDMTLALDMSGMGEIAYTVTGNPSDIGIASAIPQGWQIAIDKESQKILVSGSAYGSAFKILVVLTAANGSTASYWLQIVPLIDAVLIKAGTFLMGSPVDEPHRSTNETRHPVTLTRDFYMGKYEITNAQYADFLNEKKISEELIDRGAFSSPRYVTGGQAEVGSFGKQILVYTSPNTTSEDFGLHWDTDKWIPVSGYENSPAIFVSQYGAMAYAEWVGGMLPTEAQWEYACRAGTTTPYSYGSTSDTAYMNFNNSILGYWAPLPVGLLQPNPWGLYDMHGNAAEWCSDWYDDNYGMAEPTTSVTDPIGPDITNIAVARGGWYGAGGYGQYCRSASRVGKDHRNGEQGTGFRVIFPVN